jgi:hypothetical protein
MDPVVNYDDYAQTHSGRLSIFAANIAGRRRARLKPHLAMFILVSIAALALGAAVSYQPRSISEVCIGLFAFGACSILPLDVLPIIAVLVCVIIPVQIYKVPIGIIPFATWVVRSPQQQTSTTIRFLGVALAGWLLLTELAAPFHLKSGVTWFVTMMFAVVAPVLLQKGRPAPSLRRFYVDLATVLAGYAVLEKFVLHSSPIYATFYAHDLSDPIRQVWSTYRATTLIGQPLVNAVVFGTAFVLSVDTYLSSSRPDKFAAVRCLMLVSGLAATVSRGPTLAAFIGVVVLLFARRGKGISISKRSIAIAIVIGATIVAFPILQAREESSEGRGSEEQRSHIVRETKLVLSGHYLLGVGPGQAEAARERANLRHSGLPLESMFAEVLVEIGIPGVALLFMFLLSIIGSGLRRQRSVGAASALLTMLIALCTYSSIEARQGMIILLGMLVVLTLAENRDDPKLAIPWRGPSRE